MYLALENGDWYQGDCVNPVETGGELVFTTAYTGYEESLTDPSYYGQGLCFSYPHIGTYGVHYENFESSEVQPSFVLARDCSDDVIELCELDDVPVLTGLDTRGVVRTIREYGSMGAGLSEDKDHALEIAHNWSWDEDYSNKVSREDIEEYRGDGPTVALIDCGVKDSIVDAFRERDCEVYVYPQETSISGVKWCDPDLLFLSNGPGDPRDYHYPKELVSFFFRKIPIAGICLGQQIVALGLNGSVEKMKFGHRGSNQPVKTPEGRVIMTTQNHSYNVDDTGPMLVTHENVNDGSAEGLRNPDFAVTTRQYHPEGNPGPSDTSFFDDIVDEATRFHDGQ